MTDRRFVRRSSLVAEVALLIVLGSCFVLQCHGATHVFIRDNQVYVSRAGEKEEKVTNDEEKKYLPTLNPFNEDLVLYHGYVTRAKVPATELVIVDMRRRRSKKRIPFMQKCRSIVGIDWLTERHVGVKAWNRGSSFYYVILNIDSGVVVKRHHVGASTLSHSRKQIAFEMGVPGGYIPNPLYGALAIVVADLGLLGDRENAVVSRNPMTVYRARRNGQGSNKEELVSGILWSNDDSHVAFVCKLGGERVLVVSSAGTGTNITGGVQFPLTESGPFEKELQRSLKESSY